MTNFRIPAEVETQLPSNAKFSGKIARLFLERFPVWPIIKHLNDKEVPSHKHTFWYNMGGIILFLFAVQIITGVLLMVYYRPGLPWSSVQRLVMEVPFGNVIRSIHHWSANLMIVSLFLHMFSAFFMKAYRQPRELTWLTGAAMLALTMLFGFSGYLLPWDDLSFFATRVSLSEIEKAPIVGVWLADLVRGGSDVTIDTIGRFYALHVVILPLVALLIIGIHLTLIQIQGMSEPDSFTALPKDKKRYSKYFSDFLFREIPIWLFLGILLAALAAAFPRGLMPEADPFASAPEGIKPEWYFLSQFQLLKLFPGHLEFIGLAILTAMPLVILIIPFIDRSVPTDKRGRLVTKLGVLGLMGLVILTFWGWLS